MNYRHYTLLLAVLLITLLVVTVAYAQNGSNFGNTCDEAWTGTQDPIIRPAHGHLHHGYGATQVTNKDSGDTLRGDPTSCNRTSNSSAYWHPAVYQNGEHLPVYTGKTLGDNTIYYRLGAISDSNRGQIRSFPKNLEMIARADGGPGKVQWACAGGRGFRNFPPDVCESKRLIMRVTFPQCWDKQWVPDSQNAPEYVREPRSGSCKFPDGKSYLTMPQITSSVTFDLNYITVGTIEVAGNDEDGRVPYTNAHADYINGWDQAQLDELVQDCIRNIPHGTPDGSKPDKCRDPNNIG